MKPAWIQRRPPPRRKAAGVAIVTAIFLLVVLSGLAVAVVTISTSQQSASALDVQGQRAYQAARAGIEWAAYVALRTGSDPNPYYNASKLGCGDSSTVNPNATTFAMPTGTTLSSFTVTVQCWRREPGIVNTDPNSTSDPTGTHFRIQSTACNQPGSSGCPNPNPGPEYVQRVISAQL